MTDTHLAKATSATKNLIDSWEILDEHAESFVPRFEIGEFSLGRILGRGGFCNVHEITSVALKQISLRTDESTKATVESGGSSAAKVNTKERSDNIVCDHKKPMYDNAEMISHIDVYSSGIVLQDRKFISEKYKRDGNSRYAIKMLSSETRKDKERFVKGVMDLAIEFKILAVIRHPNIIKMRGSCFGDPFQTNQFILLDRLYDTLTKRLAIWKKKGGKLFNQTKKKKRKMFQERLHVAHDLASAFMYLHDHNIIYRDLKPDNIGFDVRGDVKLFDFGLAKEIRPSEDGMENEVFALSGNTGSLRYMAPEVCLNLMYNLKVDVFSFGILLWQMLSLNTPFSGYNLQMHYKAVVKGGCRPKMDSKWPLGIQILISNAWAEDIAQRPPFDEIVQTLFDEGHDENDDDLPLEASSRTARSL